MLVWPQQGTDGKDKKEKGFPDISERDLFLFLKKRIGRLDGVVVTGGEPTLHPDLPLFIEKIKKIGYDIKLDTNGTNPQMLQKLVKTKLIDYIAMDLKAPCEKYAKVIKVEAECNKIKRSIKIIKNSGLPYEFRTTVVPGLLFKSDFAKMGKMITGAEKWYLQKFKSDVELVNSKFQRKKPYSNKEMEEFATIGKKYVKQCKVRG